MQNFCDKDWKMYFVCDVLFIKQIKSDLLCKYHEEDKLIELCVEFAHVMFKYKTYG